MKPKNKVANKPAIPSSFENRYLLHLIANAKKYLLFLLILIVFLITATNFIANKLLLKGGESYYYLYAAEHGFYNSLTTLVSLFSDRILFLIPPLLSILSLLILFKLTEKIKLKKEFVFFFVLFFILTPTFLFSFTAFSAYSLFFLLVMAGFWLLFRDKEKIRILSLIPFIIATFVDSFSTFLLLSLQLIYLLTKRSKKIKDNFLSFSAGVTLFLLIFNKFVFNIPILIGPFHRQKIFPDLISDLGGLSGISIFMFILAVIGLAVTWKKKEFYAAYLLLPVIILAYLFNAQAIFYLSILMVFFATVGFLKLFARHWSIVLLKKLTFFLLLLGIVFSTLTYVERMSEYLPLNADQEALTWIKENTPKDAKVLSYPENAYFIKYFSDRTPFSQFYNNDNEGSSGTNLDLNQQIFSSVYIQELFPLLEKNNLSIIYINQDMKEALPTEQGFLFLLKNEKFKLIHSYQESEVWAFKKE